MGRALLQNGSVTTDLFWTSEDVIYLLILFLKRAQTQRSVFNQKTLPETTKQEGIVVVINL